MTFAMLSGRIMKCICKAHYIYIEGSFDFLPTEFRAERKYRECASIAVYDMPTAVRFYRDLPGFELVNQSCEGEEFDWCLLSRDGTQIMLTTMYESEHRPPQPDTERAAAHATPGLYFACRELECAYEHLRANGVRVEPSRVTQLFRFCIGAIDITLRLNVDLEFRTSIS